jgi:Uma2 family endonuclease
VGCSPTTVPPKDVVLLMEVAHWSLKFDTTTKANMYASLGVRDYWVINAQTLATKVHRGPSAKGYASGVELRPSRKIAPLLIPSLTLKLADLGIE